MEIYAEELVDKFLPIIDDCHGKVRWAARNAIEHLNMASKLASIDPNMAALRAITAEEEAATSLICSLKEIGYPGSEFLNAHNHTHKQGVIYFISAINNKYAEAKVSSKGVLGTSGFRVSREPGRHALELGFQLGGSESYIYPVPPLSIESQPHQGSSRSEEHTSELQSRE